MSVLAGRASLSAPISSSQYCQYRRHVRAQWLEQARARDRSESGSRRPKRALAHDLGADSVTVNSVVPGLIQTARGSSSGSTPAHHAIHQTLVEHKDYLKRLLPSLVISAATTLVL